MSEYHKINSVFKRDPKSKKLIPDFFASPELEFLADNEWIFTEKVDGTNIRIIIPKDDGQILMAGRTDGAQIPAKLVARLQERFFSRVQQLHDKFPAGAVLYGEGYGAGIQSGGNYRGDQDFVLFDVLIGQWWLRRDDVQEIAQCLDLEIVPIIGHGTLRGMVEKVRHGFLSHWGNFQAEGIVARPRIELRDRAGERIITKLKMKDFA